MSKKPLVDNAADEAQVRAAEERQKTQRDLELEDLRFLLSHGEGRRFIWRMLEHCKTFRSIWDPSARIHYNAGLQDMGHFLLAEVTEADEGSLLTMMREAKRG